MNKRSEFKNFCEKPIPKLLRPPCNIKIQTKIFRDLPNNSSLTLKNFVCRVYNWKSLFLHTKFSDLLFFNTKCHFWLVVLIFNWLMVWNRKQLHTLVLNYLLVVSKESIIFTVNWLYILTLWQQDSNWASKWAVCWDHIVALYRPLWTWTEKRRSICIWGNLLHLRENL